jgi:hypothetical protein
VFQGLSQYIETVDDTKGRDSRRAERWIVRSGGLTYLTPDAFGLLVRRLADRHRARVRCIPLFVLAVVVYLPAFHGLGAGNWDRTFSARCLAAFAILALTGLLLNGLNSRAEQRLARTLPNRASRGTALSLRMMLGLPRMTFLVAAAVLEASLSVTLLVRHTGWLTWRYPAAYLVACALAAFGLKQAATRATMAADPVSLAIDERLRSEQAFYATSPLVALVFAFPASVTGNAADWLGIVWSLAGMAILLLWLWATVSRPWRSAPSARWSPVIPVPDGSRG